MANQKFIFTGDRGFIDDLALTNGTEFEADPEVIADQGFPARSVDAGTSPAEESIPNSNQENQ